jgi:ZIP family zinc transporter
VFAVAGVAAVASPLGGLIALWRTPTSLFMSIALGFASGTLLATISFEMIPQALEQSSLLIASAGFIAGFIAIYGFDLFIHRGRLAGNSADQHEDTKNFHRRHRPRGDEVTVLAITDLIPEAEQRRYQQSAALAIGTGFVATFILSRFL